MIVKSKFMAGFDSDYVPGWDCHGLPIEHQVDKELGEAKTRMNYVEIRRRCRAYAEKFFDIQREEFRRLGYSGEWEEPYLTMKYKYQATIVRELGKFFQSGAVYRGRNPCTGASLASPPWRKPKSSTWIRPHRPFMSDFQRSTTSRKEYLTSRASESTS